MLNAQKNVVIVFPSPPGNLAGWTVDAVLDITSFKGVSWYGTIEEDTSVVIFIANRHPERLVLQPIREAIRSGLTVFIVTGIEGTISPADLGETTGEGRVFFFHAGAHNTTQEGFLPFNLLGTALQRVLAGQSLEDLEKE